MNILFKDLPLLDTTYQALEALGFETATPIQALAIPRAKAGVDLIGQAQTGTGKTFAFGIPMIEKINTEQKMTQGIILCPTRELAIQVYKEILKLVKYYQAVNVALIVGGESYEKQFNALRKKPHIVIATPGRTKDHMERGTLDLSKVTTLALDEADEMLKMGFLEDIETVLKSISEERQILLFSATMPDQIKRIAKTYLNNPEILKIESGTLTVDQIEQHYFIVKREDRLKLLTRLLDMYNPSTAIIFANTKADVDRITELLSEGGYSADALHGDLKQRSRQDVMRRIRDKQLSILVGTDVAARGLDINDVEFVINFDLPFESEVYVHRIGRTGRAGKSGKAFSFITPRKQHQIFELEKYTNAKINFMEIPSGEEVYLSQLDLLKADLLKDLDKPLNNHVRDIYDVVLQLDNKEHLINILLDRIMPIKKEYDDIEAINPKKPRSKSQSNTGRANNNNGNKGNNRNRSKGQYEDFVINLGRKDQITPPKFLQLMDKKFGIYQKNIGDIKHDQNETVFGIRKDAVSRLKTTSMIIAGKKITIKPQK